MLDYRIGTLIEYILENLEKHLSISKMAESANISTEHFHKLFKKETEMTPTQFVKHHRLEKAKTLLETTNLRVKEIIRKIGINDQSHFVRDFKEKYGSRPNEYRQKHWEQSRQKRSLIFH